MTLFDTEPCAPPLPEVFSCSPDCLHPKTLDLVFTHAGLSGAGCRRMTPWWAREITCPTCGAEPGQACDGIPCPDRIEAALVSLELRISTLRSDLRRPDPAVPLPEGFLAGLGPDRRLAALNRLEQAIAGARALLVYVGSDDGE